MGILCGTAFGVVFNKIGFKVLLKGAFKAITGFGTAEDGIYEEDL